MPAGGPAVRARLREFGRVDAPWTIGDAALLESVAVCDGLHECRIGSNAYEHENDAKAAQAVANSGALHMCNLLVY